MWNTGSYKIKQNKGTVKDNTAIFDEVFYDNRGLRNMQRKKCKNSAEWLCQHRRIEGAPWRFSGILKRGSGDKYIEQPYALEPWIPIHESESRQIMIIKPRKVAFTSNVMGKIAYTLEDQPDVNGAIILQRYQIAEKYTRDHVDAALEQSGLDQFLLNRIWDMKRFRFPGRDQDQYLYMFWSNSSNKADGPCPMARGTKLTFAFKDEKQLHMYGTDSVIEGALKNSNPLSRWTIEGGTPTVKGGILDGEFEKSTQNYFIYRCAKCHTETHPKLKVEEQILYDKNNNPYWGCVKCGANLEFIRGKLIDKDHNQELYKRGYRALWVPYNPGKDKVYDGYRFTPFTVALEPTEELCKSIERRKADGDTRGLHNEDYGESYSGGDVPFPQDILHTSIGTTKVGDSEIFVDQEYILDNLEFCDNDVLVATIDWGDLITWWTIWGVINKPDGNDIMVLLDLGRITGDFREHGNLAVKILKNYQIPGDPEYKRFFVGADAGREGGNFQPLKEAFGRNAWLMDFNKKTKAGISAEEYHKIDIAHYKQMAYVNKDFAIERLSKNIRKGQNYWIVPERGKGFDIKKDFFPHFQNVVEGNPTESRGSFGKYKEIDMETNKYYTPYLSHYLCTTIYADLTNYIRHKHMGSFSYKIL